MDEPGKRVDNTGAAISSNEEPDEEDGAAAATLQSGLTGAKLADRRNHLNATNDVDGNMEQRLQKQQDTGGHNDTCININNNDSNHENNDNNNDKDNNNLDDELDTKNLDSGYAWVILLIMFLIQSSISGSSRVYGIVYAKEVSIGYYDREQASWPIASASAIENLASILTPALAHYLSWRQIELLSTCLFISSNLIAYFSDSLWLDILALGCVQGLALSTSTPLSLAINNDYFERYRTTAYGISMSGSTFGVLYLTPIVAWLLQTYDNFRLVYLALAIVFACNLFLVLFIKPRSKTFQRQVVAAVAAVDAGQLAVGANKSREIARRNASGSVDDAEATLEGYDPSRDDSTLRCDDRHTLVAAGGVGGELGLAAPDSRGGTMSRKRSRFESRFERQNSIASISYRARSGRLSIFEAAGSPLARRSSQLSNGLTFKLDDHEQQYRCNNDTRPDLSKSTQASGAKTKPRRVASQRDANLALVANKLVRVHQLNEKNANSMVKSSSSGAELFNLTNQSGPQHQHQQQEHRQRPSNGAISHFDANLVASAAAISALDGGATQPISKLATETSNGLEGSVAVAVSGQIAKTKKRGISITFSNDLELAKAASVATTVEGSSGNSMAQQKTVEPLTKPQNNNYDNNEFTLEMLKQLIWIPYLHCTWIMLALYYLIARVFIIILVDFADDHGFSLSESTSLLNYWSVGELFGRILLGSLIDLQWMSCKSCITLTCTLLSSAIVAMVLFESYYVYAACSFLVAALISLEYMLINVLMVEYLGKRSVTSCYSLAACISSLVLFARPSLIGLFRDHLGSYDGLLMLLAAVSLAYGLLFQLLEPLLVRKWPKPKQQHHHHQQQQATRTNQHSNQGRG